MYKCRLKDKLSDGILFLLKLLLQSLATQHFTQRIWVFQHIFRLYQAIGGDFTDVAAAGQGHGDAHFFFKQVEQVGDTGFAVGSQRVDEGAADHGAVGAKGNHAHHVEAVADARVG